jgi:hypothetical protein
MKYVTALITGFLFVIALTIIVTPHANALYVSFYELSSGPDAESVLLDKLIFIHVPIYFILGFISGISVHKKFLTKKRDSL